MLAAAFTVPAIGFFTVAARMEFKQPIPSAAPIYWQPAVLVRAGILLLARMP